jgi:hypothetical protein
MSFKKEKKIIRRKMDRERIIFRKKMEELDQELYMLELKEKRQQSEQKEKYELIYSTTNKRKRSERLGINVHGSIPTSISKIHGRKPINRQTARIVGFKFKKK